MSKEEIERLNRLLALESRRAQEAETKLFWLMKEKVEIRERVEEIEDLISSLDTEESQYNRKLVAKILKILNQIGGKDG
jgi:hypothetical protein